ncbi:MAG: glycosyltransferase [Acidobacteriota bacterium]|nr:glycosyltransferase [Acidobacteriota bacterium]
MQISVLIPAYKPSVDMVGLIHALIKSEFVAIIVVDDGSGPAFEPQFSAVKDLPSVHVLRHAINLGKGAALKTGINYAMCRFPDHAGLVTADADGQHHPEDVLRIAEELLTSPDALILGVRQFGRGVPLRSRLGNTLTRVVVEVLVGSRSADTQTGLRGIPRVLLPVLLKIRSCGYEFELDMLIAAKHYAVPLVEKSIRTIYLDGNSSSHFNPVFDSMRIYFVLLRFSFVSLLTAVVDNLVFYGIYRFTQSILLSQVGGRTAAVLFNYTAARRAVFLSRERHGVVFPRYLLLVLASGTLSYLLISFISPRTGLPVIAVKLIVEGCLFLVNFAVQRDFVFMKRRDTAATDWTRYYSTVPFTANLTRKYTLSVLVEALRKFVGMGPQRCGMLVEIGGANSCFLDGIERAIRPGSYHVIDTNAYGLDLLRQRSAAYDGRVHLHQHSVLEPTLPFQADAVMSIGLIEHFAPAETRRAVLAHFDMLKPGGYALISFPTPTWLYRAARGLTEAVGAWKFPDERPLNREEVLAAVRERGEVVYEKVLWPLILTQRLLVVQKHR